MAGASAPSPAPPRPISNAAPIALRTRTIKKLSLFLIKKRILISKNPFISGVCVISPQLFTAIFFLYFKVNFFSLFATFFPHFLSNFFSYFGKGADERYHSIISRYNKGFAAGIVAPVLVNRVALLTSSTVSKSHPGSQKNRTAGSQKLTFGKSEKMTSKSDATKPFIFRVLRFLEVSRIFEKTYIICGPNALSGCFRKSQKSTCLYPSRHLYLDLDQERTHYSRYAQLAGLSLHSCRHKTPVVSIKQVARVRYETLHSCGDITLKWADVYTRYNPFSDFL